MNPRVLSSASGADLREIYEPVPCQVESIRELTHIERVFRLRRTDGQAFGHRPGQFLQVSIFGIGEAPISVSSSPTRGDYVELAVRKVGKLTSAMHRLTPGASIGVRGPFGTFFDPDVLAHQDLVLIAGGCGLAPMRSLIQYVQDRRSDFGRVTILYGARSPQDLLYRDEVAQWRRSDTLVCEVTVDTVPDGTSWDGHVGLITKLIPPLPLDPGRTVAVVVGPPVMYRFVNVELATRGLPDDRILVSLERHMKCGIGKCGHCAIGHLYCCLDGPVFRLDALPPLPEMI
jgi:sulfhydrogenase subunit gamma (sulfur reductase)